MEPLLNAPQAVPDRSASVAGLGWAALARRTVGLAILLLGTTLLLIELQRLLIAAPRINAALIGGLLAAGATALGTIPVLLSQQVSRRLNGAMLGFGAGVMLAASSFSLVIPALQTARDQGAGPWGAGGIVGAGILIGGLFLLAADRWAPHQILGGERDGPQARALKRAWLFVLAISLHNLPEGLAIGVGFAGQDAANAQALATGIAIQDVPEGLVVALALRTVGYGRVSSALYGVASGLVEPVMAVLGAIAVAMSAPLLPWGLAFAAGAMLLAVSREVIPGACQDGHENVATIGLLLGFVLMMMLDTALG
jgi:ZIP family zinc transporter